MAQFDAKKEIEYICTWIKSYFINNGPKSKAVIGMSGGKDSTVAAALLVRALGPDRVCGVLLPRFEQSYVDASYICSCLNIQTFNLNIGNDCDSIMENLTDELRPEQGLNKVVTTNLPARIRMVYLYAIAGQIGGRVVNTSNRSERYIGYSTKYGDGAGDFAILADYTVREVIAMGLVLAEEMKFSSSLVTKTPEDGLSGLTDEDNLGFTYSTLDDLLLDHVVPDYEIFKNIRERHERNSHKLDIDLPSPHRTFNIFEQ